MLVAAGDPSYERAASMLIELITFLFAVALLRQIFGADDLVFVKWKRAFEHGLRHVLSTFSSLFVKAFFQTLFLKARSRAVAPTRPPI